MKFLWRSCEIAQAFVFTHSLINVQSVNVSKTKIYNSMTMKFLVQSEINRTPRVPRTDGTKGGGIATVNMVIKHFCRL